MGAKWAFSVFAGVPEAVTTTLLRHGQAIAAALVCAHNTGGLRPVLRARLFGTVQTMTGHSRTLSVVLEPAEEGGFIVAVLAICLSGREELSRLNRLRGQTLSRLHQAEGIGVAHHQADVFILAAGSDRYLGRLCTYGTCPKGKPDCRVPGCGDHRFLQQIEGFVFEPATLAPDRCAVLFDRTENIRRKAADLPPGDQSATMAGHSGS
jgi:hypothetical protein